MPALFADRIHDPASPQSLPRVARRPAEPGRHCGRTFSVCSVISVLRFSVTS